MPRMPDISGYSFDELSRLIALANKRMNEIRGKRIRELQVEIDKLEAGPDGSAMRGGGKSARRRLGRTTTKKPAETAARSVPAQFRGPNGEEYSGRGAIPKWARSLGVNDRAGLEKYRIK